MQHAISIRLASIFSNENLLINRFLQKQEFVSMDTLLPWFKDITDDEALIQMAVGQDDNFITSPDGYSIKRKQAYIPHFMENTMYIVTF